MSQLIELKIDVKRLNKSKFFEGKKGTYATLTISVNDEVDDFGGDVSIYEAQSEEERKAKTPKVFVGNGKTFWANGGAKTASDKSGKSSGGAANSGNAKSKAPDFNDDDDLPF